MSGFVFENGRVNLVGLVRVGPGEKGELALLEAVEEDNDNDEYACGEQGCHDLVPVVPFSEPAETYCVGSHSCRKFLLLSGIYEVILLFFLKFLI